MDEFLRNVKDVEARPRSRKEIGESSLDFDHVYWTFKIGSPKYEDNWKAHWLIDCLEVFEHYQTKMRIEDLTEGNDAFLFKRGIKPLFIDRANREGGRLTFLVPAQYRKVYSNRLWYETTLYIIGAGSTSQICGAALNIRAVSDRISVWTRDPDNENIIQEIKRNLLSIYNRALPDYPILDMKYEVHVENIRRLWESGFFNPDQQ